MADLSSLVIRLSADVASLQSDLGKANTLNERYAKSASDAWSKAADSIGSSFTDPLKQIASSVASAFAVDRIVEWTKSALEAADSAEKVSQTLGTSTKTIQTLSYAAGITNTSLDSLTGAFAKLEKSANLAASGDSQTIEAFRAIGISASQAAQLLKDPDKLFQTVTQHISQFADGGGKVPAVMQLMGRSAAEQIPVINKLGQSFDDLQQKATEVGVVLSDSDTHALAEAAEKFDIIGQDVKGLANRFAIDLLPTIVAVADKFTEWAESDAAKNGAKVIAENISNVVTALAGLPEELAKTDAEFRQWQGSVGDTNTDLGKLLDLLPKIQAGAGIRITWNEPDWLKFLDAETGGTPSFTPPTPAGSSDGAWAALKNTLGGIVDGFSKAVLGADDFGTHVASAGNSVADAGKKTIDYNAKVGSTSDAYQHVEAEAAKFLSTLDGVGADKYTKALSDYNKELDQANDIFNKMVLSGASAEKAIEFIATATQKAKDGFDALTQALRNQNDADAILSTSYAKAESDLNNQIRLLGMDEEARKADELATRLITAALGDMKDFIGPLTVEQQAIIDKLTGMAGAFVKTSDAIEKQKSIVQEFAGIWKNAGDSIADSIAKWVVEGGSLMDSLVDTAKQVVEQIISQFLKLSVINPLLNSIFGGSMSGGLLPVLGDIGGAIAGGSGGGSIIGAGVDPSATASGNSSLFGTAQQGFSLFQAGKTIWSGFNTGLSNFWNGSSGSIQNVGGFQMNVPGAGSAGYNGANGGYGSGFGQALGIAGGAYAGYQEFNRAGGGAAGVAGGLAYGAGTYALGAGVASAVAGTGFAAGVSGAFAAVPVVGWAALALMVIDTLSGGKVFGTKGKFNFGEQALNVSAAGATVTEGYDLKGQKPLFGGSTHSWQDVTPDQASIDAANQFFAALKNGTEQFAKQFGATVGDVVGGTFTTTFDKKGNVTKTSDTVLGKTYADTADQFQERLDAENELAVLGTFDSKLSDAIDKYRVDADQLFAITNDLATAQKGFNDGLTLLALGSNQSTSALLALAETSGQFGESVDQTIQRILQSQAQYDQFVAQFKPATNYVDDYEGSLSQINATMQANIKQANALAVAAGAQGASEKDLANIHQYAAQQAAAALKALEASAQSLAFGLGLTTTGSLEDVNQEIAALQAKAGNGASAVRNFGAAMSDAADKAKAAMDLLLGDLSPLNDQQKLQTALSGLRGGSVTQDQVLDIGRRLYGSTAQYTALFNMVKSITPTNAGGVAGGAPSTGLNSAESARLAALLKDQTQLQAAAQLQQYQTLAQQVAEIASSKDESWQDVLKGMGINLADFEKGLGLNDQQTSDYITAIQKQTDSAGDNATSLLDILKKIYVVLGGDPTNITTYEPGTMSGGSTPGRAGGPDRGTGHSSRGIPTADEIGTAVGQAIISGLPRGGQRPTRAGATVRT